MTPEEIRDQVIDSSLSVTALTTDTVTTFGSLAGAKARKERTIRQGPDFYTKFDEGGVAMELVSVRGRAYTRTVGAPWAETSLERLVVFVESASLHGADAARSEEIFGFPLHLLSKLIRIDDGSLNGKQVARIHGDLDASDPADVLLWIDLESFHLVRLELTYVGSSTSAARTVRSDYSGFNEWQSLPGPQS